ncbi:NAD(P)-dependent oxidoreductase [Yinghuangia sp. ASG 101]|uniref:NAD-dependent epimerase/dehydratase family protein n=1 Tax=Yinghuangia sp. ASG 101 TaxID=2896848 RepID=UPI001E4AAE38|nr:NAD(P)-dependent oxidoreductase [Yinghuangia sp. ASG 101]UGQ08916.1 NAD(P)-dependent oxidoreductase [Yinghuangia sp. ASG 101]
MATTDTKNVLLAGASGALGRHITAALTATGHTVLGLGRGADADVTADLLDRDQLLRAVDGLTVDTVVHAATALRRAPMRDRDMFATDDLRGIATAHLVDAARVVGARRVIAESMVFGYGFGDFGDRVLTEADEFAPRARGVVERHLSALRVKEELILGADDFEGIALRFGLLYGEGGTDGVIDLLRTRKLPLVHDHGRVLPWLNLADAGRAVALAVTGGTPGEAYNIADDAPLGFGAYLRAVIDTFDLPRPAAMPTWMLRPMTYAHRMLTTSMRVSTAKAKAELSWSPSYPTVQDGLDALALV